jgi:hypothetical protein
MRSSSSSLVGFIPVPGPEPEGTVHPPIPPNGRMGWCRTPFAAVTGTPTWLGTTRNQDFNPSIPPTFISGQWPAGGESLRWSFPTAGFRRPGSLPQARADGGQWVGVRRETSAGPIVAYENAGGYAVFERCRMLIPSAVPPIEPCGFVVNPPGSWIAGELLPPAVLLVGRRDCALFSAILAKNKRRAASARRLRSFTERRRSGSTSDSNLAANAARALAVYWRESRVAESVRPPRRARARAISGRTFCLRWTSATDTSERAMDQLYGTLPEPVGCGLCRT